MSLTKKEKNRLSNFLGYGNPKARIWFLGMEEKLPENVVIAKEFKIRATKFERIMDLCEAHHRLERPVGATKVSQVWQWMAKIARRINDQASDWSDKQKGKGITFVQRKSWAQRMAMCS